MPAKPLKFVEAGFWYVCCPKKKICLEHIPEDISNDPGFIDWVYDVDKYNIQDISLRFLLQARNLIMQKEHLP